MFDLNVKHAIDHGIGIDFSEFKGEKVLPKVSVKDYFKMARKRSRYRNPIAPNQADIVNWVLYDRASVAASATWANVVKLFTQPVSATKTYVDTDLDQVSRLPDPQWFNATGLGIFFNPGAAPIDIYNFINTEYLQFWVGQKTYLQGPVQCFPGGAGPMSSTSMSIGAAATNYEVNTTNGLPAVQNLYDLRLPAGLNLGTDGQGAAVTSDGLIGVTILQGQNFSVWLNADAGGAPMAANNAVPVAGVGLTVACYIHGILSRGVQ